MEPKMLSGLQYAPQWVSYLGCIKGCLDYSGIGTSLGWLYGVSGHAFVLNIHPALCPSGPTAWGDGKCTRNLVQNVGCRLEQVQGSRSSPGFAAARERAWSMVRAAIGEGLPCFGWELAIPEYSVITGYDDVGYYHHGPAWEQGPTPRPWNTLGDSEIGCLEMAVVRSGKASDDAYAIKAALEFALEFSVEPPRWVREGYRGGLAGIELWISSLETGQAESHGLAYNAACWHECREQAVAFLVEARDRLGGGTAQAFDQAIAAYGAVAGALGQVAELYPFIGRDPEHVLDPVRRERALSALRTARDAEEMGLEVLGEIVPKL